VLAITSEVNGGVISCPKVVVNPEFTGADSAYVVFDQLFVVLSEILIVPTERVACNNTVVPYHFAYGGVFAYESGAVEL
jgi:hypothetical protein